jgi:AcrR family transcriptional regulator
MALEPLTRERRRAMTREHLLEAAAAVFARNGFHGSTLDEVAATAGFTKGAVYSNFKSKEDLFLALLDDRVDREAEAITRELREEGSDGSDQLPRIREIVSRMWDDTWSTLYLEFVLYASRNPQARAKLTASAERQRRVVTQMLDSEYDRIGVTPRFTTRILAVIAISLFDGLGVGRLVDPSSFTEETLHETLGFLYATIGVDSPPPIKAQR